MRKLIPLFCMAVFAACSNKNEKQNRIEKAEALRASVAAGNVYDFSGTLNNKIPVSLWYAVQDSIISGELIYTNTKDKKPIRIIGGIGPDGISMDEFLPDGTLSGFWNGKISGNTFSGTWTGKKEMPFSLQRVENAPAHDKEMFTAGDITGSYHYSYGPESGQGTLDVKKLGNDRIIYNIEALTPAPAYNQASVPDDTLELKGNEAVYKANDEYGRCNYRMRFFKDFVIIDSPEDGYECGFGHNATVTGTYIKTGNKFTSVSFD